MKEREDLHSLLLNICDNVYFQPPPSIKMVYPCITYRRDYAFTDFANNNPYSFTKRYLITVIDRDPDSQLPASVKDLPGCIYDRFYAADNLNHDVFKISF